MAFLFGAASFLGAALLFLVEPMLAKLVLPSFGGSPMVWNTCTLFFQGLLLAGYAYVHLSTRRLGPRRQPWLHLALLALPLVALPVALPDDTAPPVDGEPALWLLRVLALAAGLPFALLATTGPLLQRWFSWTSHARAEDPYFLYAASNAGSVVGLLGYPFLVEPTVGLGEQTRWWSWAYVGFAALVAACGLVAARSRPISVRTSHRPPDGPDPVVTESLPPSAGTRLGWVALAFVPSTLMLGVTTHVSTDIAAIPLFWTVPLALYLATFVVAFGRSARSRSRVPALLAAALCLPVFVVVSGAWRPAVWLSVTLDLALLGAAGLAAHGRLAAGRPAVGHLTGFYLLVSVGGALGGLLNGLVAPVVFDRPLEYPLAVAVVPLLALRLGSGAGPRRPARAGRGPGWAPVRAVVREPLALMALLLVVGFLVKDVTVGNVLRRERTFFGSYKVTEGTERRVLVHGTTLHGWEEVSGRWVGEPTSYYSRGGPIGDVMSAYRATPLLDRVALVGMGVGTLAAYGEAGRRMDFFEIDPAVVDLARSEFGYLRRSEAEIRVLLGDARLSLARRAGPTYGLIALDAFSSDAIPAHLLTVEAVRSYVRRLADGGLLAVHISNRHLDLAPVLAAIGAELGLAGVVREDGAASEPGIASTWVVLARAPADLDRLLTRADWEPLRADGTRAWTDDYSSLVQVLDAG